MLSHQRTRLARLALIRAWLAASTNRNAVMQFPSIDTVYKLRTDPKTSSCSFVSIVSEGAMQVARAKVTKGEPCVLRYPPARQDVLADTTVS